MSTGHLWRVEIYDDGTWWLKYKARRYVATTCEPTRFYWTLRGARRSSKRWLRKQKEHGTRERQAVEVHT